MRLPGWLARGQNRTRERDDHPGSSARRPALLALPVLGRLGLGWACQLVQPSAVLEVQGDARARVLRVGA